MQNNKIYPKKVYPLEENPSGYVNEDLDIREILFKLNRHSKAIAGIFILTILITGLYLYLATPNYTAETLITLDLRQSRVVDIEEVLSGGISPDIAVIGTELDIIKSEDLLGRVAKKLNLERYIEFNPALQENGGESLAGILMAHLWFLQEKSQGKEELSKEEQAQRLDRDIIGRLQSNLEVNHRGQSHTISVSYTSLDPISAAQIVNTIAELYLTDQLEAKFDATRRANEWLAERLQQMRLELQSAEQAVKNVREQSNMIQAGGTTILEQQISDVNAQLIQARVAKSRAEARLQRAEHVMNQAGGIESLDEVLDSATIQQLRSEESSLRRRRAELSQRYGPKHPEMLQIEAEMTDLDDKLMESVNRIVESMENEVQVARAEEAALVQALNQLRVEAGQAMEAELELRELERQAESSRILYESFLTRFQETRGQNDLQRPDARIISAATAPTSPSHPKQKKTIALGMAAGLMFGIMGAFLLESLDRGFRTEEQLENTTDLPVLGMIPLLERSKRMPVEYVMKKPFSSLAESLRSIRTAIHLSNVDQPPKIVMVTSALPKEGKSSFSMSMGRLSAQSGAKTLVIDADLRQPTVAETFHSLNTHARLEDLLQGSASIEEAIVKDPDSGLELLMAHGKTSAVREMLASQRMKDILDQLKEQYDFILLDTTPVMGVSDIWSLARNVDSVVFIVKWAATPRDTVRAALRQMKQLDIQINGVVMSMVNVRQQAKYGYGGYGYYYGKYKKYYED